MEEQKKYKIIKKLIETNGNKNRASVILGCSIRTINRNIAGYKTSGKKYFAHKNRYKQPVHSFSDEFKLKILNLYSSKYYDANFLHTVELLKKNDDINISVSALRSILIQDQIISPKAHKITKKNRIAYLKELEKTACSKSEKVEIAKQLLIDDSPHPRRPRCKYFGEMLQMDASEHIWFGNIKTHLHIAVDDATSTLVGAYFDEQETLQGYYNVFAQILKYYGIPYMFYTDNRTVFKYKRKSSVCEKNSFTQFGYACKQLGVSIKTTSVPQAKGRVERIFNTLQSRLPVLLRLAGINKIEQANIFLNNYLKEYNAQFALAPDNIKSVFEPQLSDEKINLALSILAERKIDNGHCVRIDNDIFKLTDDTGSPVYYRKKTNVLVIKAFNKDMFASVDGKVFSLEKVPTHEHSSKNFDIETNIPISHKKYIPPMSHPWKSSTFNTFLDKQSLQSDSSFEDMMYSQENQFKL